MSIQKSHSSKKFQFNHQVHTKSKLINSLINKKLLQEKEFVRDRFAKIVQNGKLQQLEARPSSGSKFKVRKRAGSLKNINVSMQNIKQSLLFNPLKQSLSQQAQFIISRQYVSPLLTPQQIQQVASARNNSHLIQIKLTEKDKKGYEYIPLLESIHKEAEKKQGDLKKEISWVKKIQQKLDNQLWLPGLPHTEMLLEDMDQDKQLLKFSYTNNFNQLLVVKSPTFTAHGNAFTPIKTSSLPKIAQNPSLIQSERLISSKLLDFPQIQKQEIVYDFKKYNNNDFLALQKWFQKSISLAHQKYNQNQQLPKISKSTILGPVASLKSQHALSTLSNNKHLLNLLYSIHIGGIQQLMRLHYIQAWQKALVFEKMFWSLIRLFGCLIQEQHRINLSEYKGFQRQLKQQRDLYENRCTKLQHKMHIAQQQQSTTQTITNRLALAYITYSRVNSHICQQLQYMNKANTKLQHEFDYINHRMMKLIYYLQANGQLKTIADQETTTYYMIVDNRQKLEEIITVKTDVEESKRIAKNKLEKEVQERLKKQFTHLHRQKHKQFIKQDILAKRTLINQITPQIHQQPVFSNRVGERISQLQHQLNKYWVDKQQSLHLDTIIDKQLLNHSTVQAGTSTYQKYQTSQWGTQFPQHSSQRSFGKFLKQQLQQQINQEEKKQQEDLYVSLKELYEQSYGKIRQLQAKNHSLVHEMETQRKIINQKDNTIAHLQQQINSKQQSIHINLSTISQLIKDKTTLQQQLTSNQLSYHNLQQRFHSHHENSHNLNRINLQLKEKIDKLTFKLKQTESKLSLTNQLKQHIQNQLNQTKQYQHQYHHLHHSLLNLAPYVDKFLYSNTYDTDSIIIENLKKELQHHFSQYFCKDSELFLTKE